MHGVEAFELVLALLALVVALHWLALKLGWPPATALLVGGGSLAFIPGLPAISLDPELALVLFLPPLLMDGAYYTRWGVSGGICRAYCRLRLGLSCSRRSRSAS